jgi:N-methylhydantoinase A
MKTQAKAGARIGVDIGGTFTDLIIVEPDGRVRRSKVPSTVKDYAQGILHAIALNEKEGFRRESIGEIVHGTTIATNAILEYKGAVTGLITTRGFRDVLELRRLRMPKLYDIAWQKPPPLARRIHRVEVSERMAADGSVVRPLDPDELLQAARFLVDQGVESIAVMFINSYVNPRHEEQAGELLRKHFPDIPVSLSVEIVPEIQEYERVSTTVVNAYVLPKVGGYVRSLRRSLADASINAPLLIMQSNGGTVPARIAGAYPVRIVESGPAAGVIGCRAIAERNGHRRVISFDMGGTTAKASLVENFTVQQATGYEVGGGLSMGTQLSSGGGYVIRTPSIYVAEVGAGGGSLVSTDKAGGIQVGPQSAGSDPGPACYRKGNSEPTVTDANLVLGYLNPKGLAGGSLEVYPEAAAEAIDRSVSRRLGISTLEAAYGIHSISNATMIRALRSVTTERGHDPSEYVMYAFGGSGPIHAVHIAQAMEIKTVVIPPSPGLFSAFGLLLAPLEHSFSRTLLRRLHDVSPQELMEVIGQLEAQARSKANDPEYPVQDLMLRRSLDLRFLGQSTELTLSLPNGPLDANALADVEARFHAEYERTYGFRAEGEALEIVHVRVVAQGPVPDFSSWTQVVGASKSEPQRRSAYFGPKHGVCEAKILTRQALLAGPQEGPLIIEEYDSSTVVPPGCVASCNENGCVVIEIHDRSE